MPAHSPLGASSAERWMNCPGSVALIQMVGLDEHADEPEYRQLGTHAHALAALCLEDQTEAWEHIGEIIEGIEVAADTTLAVQLYLDTVRNLRAEVNPEAVFIEYGISSPVHPLFYGTLDCGFIAGDTAYINDYKHGEGIAVDVEYNPQVRYYGWGLVQDHPEVVRVVYRIIQPRGFHPDGKVRVWEESADSLRLWINEVLVPAMDQTSIDHGLDSGEHCRFCPAKLICPMLTGLFGAAMRTNPQAVKNLSDLDVGLNYERINGVKFYIKALEEEAFRRLSANKDLGETGPKLVNKKANRVWKAGAKALFTGKFGDKAYEEREFKSPAEMEKISTEASELVHEYAFTPQSGLTVAPFADKRAAVKVKSITETFAAAVAATLDKEQAE